MEKITGTGHVTRGANHVGNTGLWGELEAAGGDVTEIHQQGDAVLTACRRPEGKDQDGPGEVCRY